MMNDDVADNGDDDNGGGIDDDNCLDTCFLFFQVIGAFLTAPWSDRTVGAKDLQFFGTGESFVFCLVPNSAWYPWLGVHGDKDDVIIKDYFMAGNDKYLIIGGGLVKSVFNTIIVLVDNEQPRPRGRGCEASEL